MPRDESAPNRLQEKLRYTFHDRSLLETALTHTSFVKSDKKKRAHNERMEFLGDAVLEFCVSEYLYRRYSAMQEGAMTRHRARLVCEQALYAAAVALHVPESLYLGHGEEATGGREKPSIVSDAMEAIIGAVFLDGGVDAARAVVIDVVIRLLEEAHVDERDSDYKTRLQEYVQQDHIGVLSYVCQDETGPEHQKLFTIRVLLSEKEIGRGTGKSKQLASQAAARDALIRFGLAGDKACD